MGEFAETGERREERVWGMNFPACPGRLIERGKRLCPSLPSSADEVKNFLIIGNYRHEGRKLKKTAHIFQ